MASGLRVEFAVASPGDCPVADVSAGTNHPVTSVSRTSVPDDDGRIVEEFTADRDAGPDRADVEQVAAYETHAAYQFRREQGSACVCETIERFGYPVVEIRGREGALLVSFHVPDVDAVKEIVTALRKRFGGVQLRTLVRSTDRADPEFVIVDRNTLTDRQQTVLETAFEMGYFEYRDGANAEEVAAALDISPSTFSEHLSSAQRKLLGAIVQR